uniref:NADH dehydrogenase subunit 3 n=1 Tax=Puliciphora borinquenensis TaxID=92546 RepID=UPI001D0FC18E|nr:NADH dehydrogenase subunit 3 [Puliciphora borinquenensis]QZL38256.1 NADH dehydrogenase subunit 3 [Puliciphora borinquenensis]
MFSIFFVSSLFLLISMIMIFLAMFLSKKTIIDREKSSPFECGFDPKSSARLPFSLHFFLIAIIFLIFDVEITLILPMIICLYNCNILSWIFTCFFFILVLLLGTYHEWAQGALTWSS